MGSWVAVEPNGTGGLPSTLDPPRLGALLPSPRRARRRRFQQATASRCHSSPPLLHFPTLELLL
ncbi:hypothetical protein [Vulcanisaeta souniana]|uniref:hypothetical protein n=1 Tax=Vulcanisaeta souniana TaxID=164452 RepID=UPI001FB2EC55|nr:hypothetical protein [Vulcanisaeta souniana]